MITSAAKHEVEIEGHGTDDPAIPKETPGKIRLPETVKDPADGSSYVVNGIGTNAFTGCTNITETGLATNSTVKYLDYMAFDNCTSLTSTGLISNSAITSLGEGAFQSCTSLTSTGLESNISKLTSVGDQAFLGCTSLTSTGLATNSTVISLGQFAFSGCAQLPATGLESNSSVSSLGASAFEYCTSLTSTGLEKNSTITSLDNNGVFLSCTSLTSTGLESKSSKVTYLAGYSFYNCTSLTSTGLATNSTVKDLGSNCFGRCSSLTSTGLARNTTLQSIGSSAFGNCSSLGTVEDVFGGSSAGDLVLNAPAGGGKLEVRSNVFGGTKISRLYLQGKKQDFDFKIYAFDQSSITTVYVPASWVGTESWSDGDRTFSVSDGTLVIMDGAEMSDMSAVRIAGAHGDAKVSLTTNVTSPLHLTSSDGTDLGEYPFSSDAQGHAAASVPAARGLTAGACRLTASCSQGATVYPAGSKPRKYNTGTGSASVYCDLSAVAYAIAFDANGGGGDMAAMSMSWGVPRRLSACGFTRDGRSFSSWNTAADGSGAALADRESVSELSDVEGATVTLFARWSASVPLSVHAHVLAGSVGEGGPLAGCGFALATDRAGRDLVYSVFTDADRAEEHRVTSWPLMTGSDGDLKLYGLTAGTYYVINLKVPAGYQLRADPPSITVGASDDRPVRLDIGFVPNPVLPSAGKLSAPPLAAAGGTVTVLSAAYLAARTRQGR